MCDWGSVTHAMEHEHIIQPPDKPYPYLSLFRGGMFAYASPWYIFGILSSVGSINK